MPEQIDTLTLQRSTGKRYTKQVQQILQDATEPLSPAQIITEASRRGTTASSHAIIGAISLLLEQESIVIAQSEDHGCSIPLFKTAQLNQNHIPAQTQGAQAMNTNTATTTIVTEPQETEPQETEPQTTNAPDTEPPATAGYTFRGQPYLAVIPLDDIDRSRNHRITRPGDEQRIQQLMESIRHRGQLQPVRVYLAPLGQDQDQDKKVRPAYILGFGARRCRALELIGETNVRAEVYPETPDHEIEAARAVENLDRQDITPIEEAQAVADIMDAYFRSDQGGLASRQEAIEHTAAETGRSITWVRDRDYFARLDSRVRELALRCDMPAGHLRELAKLGEADAQFSVACQCLGTWTHYFKKGTLEPAPGSTNKEVVAELFGEVEGGQVTRWSLKRVKARVEEYQRSLRSVPWSLELPMVVSPKKKFPACNTCEHNTATDLTLFGMEDVEDMKAQARCMKPACFEEKTKAAEKARQKAAATATRRIAKAKEDEPDAQAQALAKDADKAMIQAPHWLDAKKLDGYVKRQQKKAKDSGLPASETASQSNSGGGGGRRPLTTHEKAIQRYETAVVKWFQFRNEELQTLINAKTEHRAGWILLSHCEAICDLDEIRTPHITTWSIPVPSTNVPKFPSPLSSDVSRIIALASSGKPDEIVKLADETSCEFEPVPIEHLPNHPQLVGGLLLAFGHAGDYPNCPEWVDFAPSAEKPAKKPAKKKPAKKKKAARKKISKQEAVSSE